MDGNLWAQAKFLFRLRFLGRFELERELEPFLHSQIRAFEKGGEGWLERARKAKLLSLESVAQRMKISRVAYQGLEKGERNGTVTLQALSRATESLDCELVYAIRPKVREHFSESICQIVLGEAFQHPSIQRLEGDRKIRAAVARAGGLLESAEFRRRKGWTRLKEERSHQDVMEDGRQFIELNFG